MIYRILVISQSDFLKTVLIFSFSYQPYCFLHNKAGVSGSVWDFGDSTRVTGCSMRAGVTAAHVWTCLMHQQETRCGCGAEMTMLGCLFAEHGTLSR